jgi:hypothetical protein
MRPAVRSWSDKPGCGWGSTLLAVLLMGVLCSCVAAQNGSLAGNSEATRHSWSSGRMEGSEFASNEAVAEATRHLRQVYLEQEKSMVKDTVKLLELTKKFNAEVHSGHGSQLTPSERREVAQIAKLAHSIRTKMTEPVPSTLLEVGPYSALSFR